MSAGRKVNTQSREWGTPGRYVKAIRSFLGTIHLDPCSNTYSIVHAEIEYLLP